MILKTRMRVLTSNLNGTLFERLHGKCSTSAFIWAA